VRQSLLVLLVKLLSVNSHVVDWFLWLAVLNTCGASLISVIDFSFWTQRIAVGHQHRPRCIVGSYIVIENPANLATTGPLRWHLAELRTTRAICRLTSLYQQADDQHNSAAVT